VALVSMKELLEAGVHFGHQTRRWNPKMKRYIYGERGGIYIIDLHQTLRRLEAAYEAARDIVATGKTMLFVGTKRQAQESIAQSAERAGQFFVNQRWLGGMLTNWGTMRSRVGRLGELIQMDQDGTLDRLPKKEAAKLTEQREKLERYFGGIAGMDQLPGVAFIVDLKKEHLAVAECNKLGIATVAILDTNCDPDLVNYIVPGNDDAIRAIRLMAQKMADACLEGRAIYAQKLADKEPGELTAEERKAASAIAAAEAARAAEEAPPVPVVEEVAAPEAVEAVVAVEDDEYDGAVEDQFIER